MAKQIKDLIKTRWFANPRLVQIFIYLVLKSDKGVVSIDFSDLCRDCDVDVMEARKALNELYKSDVLNAKCEKDSQGVPTKMYVELSDTYTTGVKKRALVKVKEESDLSFIEDSDMRTLMERWIRFRKEIKKPILSADSIRTQLKKLTKMSDGNIETAKAIVEQSIANQWQGLFELKDGRDNTGKLSKRDANLKSAIEQRNRIEAIITEPSDYEADAIALKKRLGIL